MLPSSYKESLLKYGACLFEKDVFYRPLEHSPWSPDGKPEISCFYGIVDESGFDVREKYMDSCGDILPLTLPIGNDVGGNIILLCLKSGCINLFNHETAAAKTT